VVIEHTFVTTMEPGDTMRAASSLLGSRGFEQAGGAFAVGSGEWNTLEMRRRKTAARARNIAQLPQTAHVQWDRGRVTVVLGIEPSAVWGGGGFSLGFGATVTDGNAKKMKLHTELLMAIANALEAVLVRRQPPEAVTAEWDRVEAEIHRAAKRRLWRNVVILVVFFAFIGGLIALAVINS
jgi:hypothetical protein